MNILLTGGTGYIGSHAAVVLAQAGHVPVLYDNLCNSRAEVAQRVSQIVGRPLTLVRADLRDQALLAHTLAGAAHLEAGEVHEALAAIGRALALDPADPSGRILPLALRALPLAGDDPLP